MALRAVVAVWALTASVPQPRMIWELKLADEHGLQHDVQGLRFSWDGKWIAAVVAHLRTEESAANDLVIVPVGGEAADVRRVTIKEELLSTPQHPGIHWSPGGEYLALETKHFSTILLRVVDKHRCELPRTTVFGGFVGPDRVIAADWELPKDPAYLPATFSTMTTYGADCQRIESARWRGQIRAIEPYAPGGLLAVNPEQSDIRVLWLAKTAEVGRLPESSGSVLRFGEKGKVLCKGYMPGHGVLACWDLATGGRVAHPELVGGAPMDVSSESSVVVATESDAQRDLMSDTTRWRMLHWIVWDYRSGRELARLPYKRARHGYEASPAAISPDGRRVAIGAGDLLRLYEIPAP